MRDDHENTPKPAQRLESPDAEFRMNNRRVILCLVIAAVVCVVGLAVIFAGFVVAFPEPVINMRVATILMGTCMLVVMLFLFASNWKKYGQRVVLCPEGFDFHKGGHWSVVRWDEVTAVWRRSSTIGSSRVLVETDLWIQTKDGKMVYLTSFFLDMARLVEVVLTETARRMVPAMSSQLRQGQTLDFGKVKITATELVASGKVLAWEDVQAIRVACGAIDIRRKGDNACWYYRYIKEMPNYHVFLAVADSLLKQAQG